MPQYTPHPSVVCTVIEDGGVLLHLDTKFYYSLNRTGLAVWSLLEAGHPDPAAELAGRFAALPEPREAVRAFLDDLEREQLVCPDGESTATVGPLDLPADEPWAPPRLTRHDVPLNQILSNPFDPCVPLAE